MNRNKDEGSNRPAGSEIEWHEGDMPYSPGFGDHFYSRADGRAESDHVFLKGNGLPERWQAQPCFTIAELGFGTGLNFAETWRQWSATRPPNGRLRFISFERFPLKGDEITRALDVWPDLTPFSRDLTSKWPDAPSRKVRIDFEEAVTLEVHVGDALSCLSQWGGAADAWFLDGFAPARNPEMWSEALMCEVYKHTKPSGSFATYTAAGWVRRNLEAAGFTVRKQKGYAGKRDMTVGSRGS